MTTQDNSASPHQTPSPRNGSFPLNSAQSDAVSEFDRNILVSAGAGTGKTRVLTEKFLRLLEDRRAAVNEIVAITFTKKAAAEMRERIQARVKERLESSCGADEDYWKNQLALMETARISTFHSFCLGLIKEYPLEAGIGPIHRVFGDGEESIYLQETIEKVFVEAVHDSTHASQLTGILVETGWESLVRDLSGVYQKIRENGVGLPEIMRQTRANIEKAIADVPFQISHLIEEIDTLLENSTVRTLTERARSILDEFKQEWVSYQNLLQSEVSLTELLPVLANIKKALPRNLPKSIKENVDEIHEIAGGLTRKLLDQEALRRLPVYADLLERIDCRYSVLKRELGALDFTDQLVIARNLLRSSPELTQEIRNGIRYLLVDEFQDTNSLQMELVDLLVGDHPGSGSGRLMAVGDIKQSIYRFRGAEADVIRELGERMRDEGGRLISLSENYRSQNLVIRFINAVSETIFTGETFQYEPLIAHCTNDDAAIEFILTGETDRTAEADAIAARILELVNREPEMPVRFQDIVILFRAATSAGLYQQALKRAGIPYFTSSGSSFFTCQEVADQLNLLRLVEQRFDGVALLSLLASPYVGLSYESLLWLGEGNDLVEGFYRGQYSEKALTVISTGERDRLDHFRDLLEFLHQNREIMRIPDVLRMALERSDYLEILWTLPDAVQCVANLEKLIAKAEEFSGRGFHDLHLFLRYIDRLEQAEVVEGEAQTQAEAGDVVRLMTIHRSKGLEFPIVFLPDLDRQFRFGNRSRIVFHKKVGLAYPIGYGHKESGKPTPFEQFKAIERREEIAELKRILYVALTRVKQKLFLVGSGTSRSKGTTFETAANWMKWFELLLPLDSTESTVDFHSVPVDLKRGEPVNTTDKPIRLIEKLAESLRFPEHPQAGEEVAEVAAARVLDDDLAVQRDLSKKRIVKLNVSEILTFKQCPRKFFWEYRHRLKPRRIEGEPDTVSAFASSSGLGSEIGSFFHRAIRRKNSEWPQELWETTFGGRQDAASIRKDVQRMWTHYQQSGFGDTTGERWDEFPFLVALSPELRIEGRFDRLIRDDKGEMQLVDFKTHRTAAANLEAVSRSYLWQLQLYALAIEKLWHRLPDRACLYYPYPHQTVDVPLDPAGMGKTLAEIGDIRDFIADHEDLSDYPATGDCKHCGYRSFCER